MRVDRVFFAVVLTAMFGAACGGDDSAGSGGDDAGDLGDDGDVAPDGGDVAPDGGAQSADAQPGVAPCTPQSAYACSNCLDDDEDGLVDGQDPECQGPEDRLEDSFTTGIPGDNRDPKSQECFFDGNSGQCQVHTCCLLADGACPDDLLPFDRAQDCENLDAPCLTDCLDLTPVGCDCYGCCTVCNPETNDCADILLQGAPEVCDPGDIGTATAADCLSCVKVSECNAGECQADPDDCTLCPGQTDEDLPSSCDDNECPSGSTSCQTTGDCDGLDYCSNGCCRAGGVD